MGVWPEKKLATRVLYSAVKSRKWKGMGDPNFWTENFLRGSETTSRELIVEMKERAKNLR